MYTLFVIADKTKNKNKQTNKKNNPKPFNFNKSFEIHPQNDSSLHSLSEYYCLDWLNVTVSTTGRKMWNEQYSQPWAGGFGSWAGHWV